MNFVLFVFIIVDKVKLRYSFCALWILCICVFTVIIDLICYMCFAHFTACTEVWFITQQHLIDCSSTGGNDKNTHDCQHVSPFFILSLALYQPLWLPHSVTFVSFGFCYQPAFSFQLSFTCLLRWVLRCCVWTWLHCGKTRLLKTGTFPQQPSMIQPTFRVCFSGTVGCKSILQMNILSLSRHSPSTHTASVCLSRAASKQTAWLLPSNTTNVEYLYDFCGCFSESCSLHNDYIMSNEYSW